MLESVRTASGPHQKVIASWTDCRILFQAIEQAETAFADASERYAWIDSKPSNALAYLKTQEWVTARKKVDACRRKLRQLQVAMGALGNWQDAVSDNFDTTAAP